MAILRHRQSLRPRRQRHDATQLRYRRLQVYNISNNQITGSAFIGTVGLDWQFSGIGNFSSVLGQSDLLLRNTSTGALQGYNPTTIS